MAYLNQPDYVCYMCNCCSLKPISKIYFCRHCLKIRCGYCICQEVDSFYCPNCMENLSSTEVRLKKNKCSNCFNCPSCFQMLSTRAGHVSSRVPAKEGEDAKDGKVVSKKVYYLSCSFCRWSSRDAGIPDQSMATGKWSEQENCHTRRINALIDYHKILSSTEKQQRERKFQPDYLFKPFKTRGLTSAAVRKLIGQSIKSQIQSQASNQITPSVATEEVEELPPEIFTEPIDITKISTLEQRLEHPDVQAEFLNQLRPQHRQFLIKKSQRCRTCEHYLSKPCISSESTKFKIQLAAFYHIPEVKIVTCEPLYAGKSSELFLKFCNPTQHPTQITLFPLDVSMEPIPTSDVPEKGEGKQDETQTVCDNLNSVLSVTSQTPVIAEMKTVKIAPTADLVLPHSSLILPARDDTAEYDDTADTHNFQDDPKLVIWRKGNKAVVRLHVTPFKDDGMEGKPVIVGFVMQYGYVNTITALEHKVPQKFDLKTKLYLTLGKLCGTA